MLGFRVTFLSYPRKMSYIFNNIYVVFGFSIIFLVHSLFITLYIKIGERKYDHSYEAPRDNKLENYPDSYKFYTKIPFLL